MNLVRGKFRVRGDVVEIHPAYDETAVRVEFFGDDIEAISVVDPLTGRRVGELDELAVFPNTHYATSDERLGAAIKRIESELQQRLAQFECRGQAARGAATAHAHRVRPRDAHRDGLLQRGGELLGATATAVAPARLPTRCSTSFQRTISRSSTSPTWRSRSCTASTRGTVPARNN